MKKTLQLLLALFAFTYASAQEPDGDGNYHIGNFKYSITDVDGTYVTEVLGFADGIEGVTDLVIPATINVNDIDFSVDAIGWEAFHQLPISTVALPPSVKTITRRAFRKTGLTAINLENVTHLLLKDAFSECKLSQVDLSSLKVIADFSFNANTNLTTVAIPVAEELGAGAFRRCVFSEIIIPSSVTTMGAGVFSECSNLKSVQLDWTGDDIISVDLAATFGGVVTDLKTITVYVPQGTTANYTGTGWDAATIVEGKIPVSYIGEFFTVDGVDYTITEDDEVHVTGSSLSTVTIPATVTRTGETEDTTVYNVVAVANGAFLNNTTVESVVLPVSVKILYTDAFSGCENLETINLEHVVAFSGQNTFFNTPKLTTVNLASATELVGNFAFHGLGDSSLTSVSIPNAVTLARALFSTAQFQTINIPESVTSISTKTFWNCTALTDVQVNWTTLETIPAIDTTQDVPASTDPETGTEIAAVAGNATFLGVDVASVNLLVPAGTESLYAGAEGWKDFNIVVGQLSAADIVNNSLNIQVSAEALTVTSSSTFTNGSLSIYDITGRELSSTSLNSASASVNISNLASGVYIVKVTEGNAKLVKRFVKQ